MFDGKLREEYLEIKAPPELYERIMNAEGVSEKKNNIVTFRKVVSLAAAVAIIISAGFFFVRSGNTPGVYMGTEKLTGEVSITENSGDGISLARAMNEISCELTFDIKNETVIVLSDGFLCGDDGNVILESGNEESFSEKLSCKWIIPMADESKEYEISLKNKNGEYFVKLYFDGQEKIWTACLTK